MLLAPSLLRIGRVDARPYMNGLVCRRCTVLASGAGVGISGLGLGVGRERSKRTRAHASEVFQGFRECALARSLVLTPSSIQDI